VVAAMMAAEPKENPMRKAKSKSKTASRLDGSKTKGRNGTSRKAAPKSAKLMPGTQSKVDTRPQSLAQLNGSADSKKAQIIAMLRAPGGATIEAMAHAMGWQRHSVRGFLAGVVRKKLGLNLVSAESESGRQRVPPTAAR
jgi:hypothetical protein